jgi:predicted nucleic acid-binding protein
MPDERGRLRVYGDTSAIGGCFDAEFATGSRALFERFRSGDYVLVISDVTLAELQNAPPAVREVVSDSPPDSVETVLFTAEAERLAKAYLTASVLPQKMWADAQHIAIATLAGVDVLVSWNFKHVVNLRRIHGYNEVNAGLGYPSVEIRTPREVVNDE